MAQSEPTPFLIVGIGASAGGLKALERFFRALPPAPGIAFVIITHLAPDRPSLLTEILARQTVLPVEVAQDGQTVEKDTVYVLPPRAILTIAHGVLKLHETDIAHHERMPINVFFSSLAEDCGEYAIGIVLSGSGSDGVLGVKAIKECGGVTFAQAKDAAGPGFAGMPDSAIASGLVDFVIPVDAMPAKLVENLNSFGQLKALDVDEPATETDHALIEARNAIYTILRDQAGHDFSGYKTGTFLRRVHRRMQVRQCDLLSDYVQLLRGDADEATSLFRDRLINVTSFFRDSEAFEALRQTVIPRLFEGKGASDWIRVWVPGCSTGEEAISIAILMREQMDQMRSPPRVTIFATDIDEPALTTARAGHYPELMMQGVSPERLERFFTASPGVFTVAKSVRDLCVFSSHNILRDPPFSRMDMISCRNLLIYFSGETQRQIFPIFHYALRPGGFLFLGISETIGRFTDLFAPADKNHCLYQSRVTGTSPRVPIIAGGSPRSAILSPLSDRTSVRGSQGLRQIVEARLVDLAPPHVVVNVDGEIVYFSARTGKYLETPSGPPSRQLLTMARRELRLDLRNALSEAAGTRQPAVRDDIRLETGDRRLEQVSLTVEPLPARDDGPAEFLVLFKEGKTLALDATAEPAASVDASGALRCEDELRDTRERLQTTIEEYETALEELKSANEELVSLNEETQSSNEELESSKEEMQSLNEEMQTVNQELRQKIDELDHANNDAQNLFASTKIATIFLDHNLGIRTFTPAATQLFNLIATDTGRPLTDLTTALDYTEFHDDIRTVLDTGLPKELRVKDKTAEPRSYLARLTPYVSDQSVEGVVASFIDITGLVRSEHAVEKLFSERLATINILAAGLAHELNQPLTAVANYLYALKLLLPMAESARPAKLESVIDKAVEGIMQAGGILSNLRSFIARREPDKTIVSLREMIGGAQDHLKRDLEQAKVKVTLQLDAENDEVVADKTQIRQVLVNLMRNACEAMSGDRRELTISSSRVDDGMIQVDIADTGAGLAKEVENSLFEPFLTTKESGMGIGLPISRLIVEAHHGKIWSRPNAGGGTVFSFTLPLLDEV
jgi:two-component system CheB/CheR fusion protein